MEKCTGKQIKLERDIIIFQRRNGDKLIVCGDECIFTGLLYKLCANQSGNRRNDHVELKNI